MIKFTPPELRERLELALAIWDERIMRTSLDDKGLPTDWDSSEAEGDISDLTEMCVHLGDWDHSHEMTVAHFLELVSKFQASELKAGLCCVGRNRMLWRIIPQNHAARRLLNILSNVVPEDQRHANDIKIAQDARKELKAAEIQWDIEQLKHPDSIGRSLIEYSAETNRLHRLISAAARPIIRRHHLSFGFVDQGITINILSGVTEFALHVVSMGLYHSYEPAFSESDEAYIEINYERRPSDERSLDQIIQSYLFELSASMGAEFILSPREIPLEYEEEDYEDEDTPSLPVGLRQLVLGKGVQDLMSLYNRAIGTFDSELRILCFTKVIEFVSQTATKRQSSEALRNKLLSSRALNPDTLFISELETLFEQQRNFKKDKEAIKLAITLSCDASELQLYAPPFLKKMFNSDLSEPKEQALALSRFADVLFSTRNAIAHAKANYTPTGDECPPEEMERFSICCKVAAEHSIRWFGGIAESLRIYSPQK